MNINDILKKEFNLRDEQINNTIKLIDEGNTIPFIARYRKEMTGEMSDVTLRAFYDKLIYLRNLQNRKDDVIRIIEEQGKLTSEIKVSIEKANTLQEVEDIELVSEEEYYRPELDNTAEEGLSVEIDEDGVYVVTGKKLRRIMYSVDFEDMESIQFFQKTMENEGVFDKLREMGIEDGDTVKIYEIEFEFYH